MRATTKNAFWTVSAIAFAVWALVFVVHWIVGSPPKPSTLAVYFIFYFVGWLVATLARGSGR